VSAANFIDLCFFFRAGGIRHIECEEIEEVMIALPWR
jgi:hypothetical protein